MRKMFKKDPLMILCGYATIALHIIGIVGMIWLIKFGILVLINC